MDISSIIFAVIILSLLAIPFYFFYPRKSERKKMKAKINQVVTSNGLTINEFEMWGDTYIGIDSAQKKLLFLKISEIDGSEQELDMRQIEDVELIEKRTAVMIKNQKESILEKLDIIITFKNKKKQYLNFYDASHGYVEDFEMLRVKKWLAIISASASIKQPVKAAI